MKRRRREGVLLCAGLAAALALMLIGAGGSAWGTSAHAQSGSCVELVVNGGFENGDAPWTQDSKLGYPLIDPFHPHSGQQGAWLGGEDNAEDHLGQAVVLPADPPSLTLHFWWSIHTEEAPGGAFDLARAELLAGNGSVITTTLTVNHDSAEDQFLWAEASADLTPYSGQTVQLRFSAQTDDSNPTSFFFDDVSIMACADATTPTPTSRPRARLFLPTLLR